MSRKGEKARRIPSRKRETRTVNSSVGSSVLLDVSAMDEFESFYRDNLGLLYAVALARGLDPSRAEDLAQETLLRAWRHFGRLLAMEPPARRAWLIRTLRHLAIDEWRRERSFPEEVLERSEPGPEPAERAALRLDVARAMSGLEDGDRELVVLRYFMEMNSREIGEVLGMPEGTVRHRLMRCRQYLAVQLVPWKPEGAREG
jgi:RNA polymerase sigma-70 factor (ECF subfamily)